MKLSGALLLGIAQAGTMVSPDVDGMKRLATQNDVMFTPEQAAILAEQGVTIPKSQIPAAGNAEWHKGALFRTLWNNDDQGNGRYKVRFMYDATDRHTDAEQQYIQASLDALSEDICIDFVEVTNPTDNDWEKGILRIVNTGGCSSYIGRTWMSNQNPNGQLVTLGPGCVSTGVIQHEFYHAMGFDHEQTRSDRDDYVNIKFENIEDDMEYNFYKNDATDHHVMAESPYDFWSVMQYSSYSFSMNGGATITKKTDDQPFPVQRVKASSMDVYQLCKIYDCQRCAGHTDYISEAIGDGKWKLIKCKQMENRYYWPNRCNDGFAECSEGNDDENIPCGKVGCCNSFDMYHHSNTGVGLYTKVEGQTNNGVAVYKNDKTPPTYIYSWDGNSNWHIGPTVNGGGAYYWHSNSAACPDTGKEWHSHQGGQWVVDNSLVFVCRDSHQTSPTTKPETSPTTRPESSPTTPHTSPTTRPESSPTTSDHTITLPEVCPFGPLKWSSVKRYTKPWVMSQDKIIYKTQVPPSDTSTNQNYLGFIKFSRKLCGLAFANALEANQIRFEIFDKAVFYDTTEQFSFGNSDQITIQFCTVDFENDVDEVNLATKKNKDVFYIEYHGLNDVDFGNKVQEECLQKIKIAIVPMSDNYDHSKNYAKCAVTGE